MKVPLSWLKDYVDITLPVDDLAERLTLAGLEAGSIVRIGDWWDRDKIVVAEIREIRPHPDADRLVLADVDYGGTELEQCVTGAPNLFPFKGQGPISLKVPFAMEGAELYDGHQEGMVKMRLKRTKIRGVPSRAMVCSEKELGISEDHEGIMLLPADAPVGVPLADYLGDTVLDLDVTPNMARALSLIGVAREVAALTGAPLRYPSTEWQTATPPAAELACVQIDDPDLCSRYIATIIRDVHIGPAPRWMQDRVHKAGMRPISNIVDVTNYVMLEWGQPLHAFDYDKLVARAGGTPTIIVRRARPGETMTTLDGVLRTFAEDTLLICDTAGPIAVAGVMGGLETEIDDSTRNILLESANFNFISVRRTTQALKLPSEASLRFGKGIHPALADPAVRRASELMRELGGAQSSIAAGMVDAYPVPAAPIVIVLTSQEVARILGVPLSTDETARILAALEFLCEPLADGALRVTVPPHRLDCQHPADLIEEVARIHGYDRIPSTQMADRLPAQRANRSLELEEQVRDLLVSCGLQEIVTYSLTSLEREAALVSGTPPTDLPLPTYVVLANPISSERSVMRHSLLPGALEIAASNLRHREQVAVFELAKVFWLGPGAELPAEPRHLSIVMAGRRDARGWLARDSEAAEGAALDFYDLKGVIEALLRRLHVSEVAYTPVEAGTYQPGRTARLSVCGVDVGLLGELHPAVRAAYDLPAGRVAAAELDLEALVAQVPRTWFVAPLSPYPAVLQDVAVVVDESVPAAAVHALIVEVGGYLLKRAELFDVYRGAPVPTGKKSLAYALTFQAPDRTLNDALVSKQVERIVQRLRRDLGADLRA